MLLSSQLVVGLVSNTWLYPCVTRVVAIYCTKSRISHLISDLAASPFWVQALARVEHDISAPPAVLLFFLEPDVVRIETLHFIPNGITTDCSSLSG